MSEIGRRAIMADPDWQGGDYYGTERRPDRGLAIARMAGMMTYQSAAGQWERFAGGPPGRPALYPEFGGMFEIESYLHYQGRELTGRFDANSYLYLSKAMDLYDVASGYESEEEAPLAHRSRSALRRHHERLALPGCRSTSRRREGETRRREGKLRRDRHTKRPRRLPEGLERAQRSDTTVHRKHLKPDP